MSINSLFDDAVPFEQYAEKIRKTKPSKFKNEKTYSLPKEVRSLDTGKIESVIQKEIGAMLKAKGIFHNRIEGGGKIRHSGENAYLAGSSQKGMSDILCCINGWYVAVEVKRPSGKAKASQLNYLRDVIKSGGRACIATGALRLWKWLETGEYQHSIEYLDEKIPVL